VVVACSFLFLIIACDPVQRLTSRGKIPAQQVVRIFEHKVYLKIKTHKNYLVDL
jgi:hypothetical protein